MPALGIIVAGSPGGVKRERLLQLIARSTRGRDRVVHLAAEFLESFEVFCRNELPIAIARAAAFAIECGIQEIHRRVRYLVFVRAR
jgi:hypothetical protein